MTLRPWSSAASSRDRGGIVCGMRTVFIPDSTMSAKSRLITSRSWYSLTGRVGLECSVRHPLDVQLLVTDEEELAVNPWPSTGLRDVRERVRGERGLQLCG